LFGQEFFNLRIDSYLEKAAVEELVSQELLALRHGDSSGTQRKEYICHLKPLPEERSRHS
jgi:hypothetical protein